MADLQTTYMGIKLKNPIVVGACSLSKKADTIKQIEAAGAGALVIKSLFEEQVQLERAGMEEELQQHDEMFAEAVSMFPNVEHGGPDEFLYWVHRARNETSLPLIASLNAVTPDIWVEWATKLADTGVDGLELNFYSLPIDPDQDAAEIEKAELEAFARVRAAVKLPIAVKLHPYYTNMLNVASAFDRAGADAVVLFNRLFQPDLNVDKEAEVASLSLSSSADMALPLRWTALCHGRVEADIIGNTGIITGQDVIKMILAGASAVQVVSTLYLNKITVIGEMLEQLSGWMDHKGYATLDDFRGKVSKQKVKDPWGFERGQYIKALLGFD